MAVHGQRFPFSNKKTWAVNRKLAACVCQVLLVGSSLSKVFCYLLVLTVVVVAFNDSNRLTLKGESHEQLNADVLWIASAWVGIGIFIEFLGLFGIIFQRVTLIAVYTAVCLFLFLIPLSLLIYSVIFYASVLMQNSDPQDLSSVSAFFVSTWRSTHSFHSSSNSTILDYYQQKFKCCGYAQSSDWDPKTMELRYGNSAFFRALGVNASDVAANWKVNCETATKEECTVPHSCCKNSVDKFCVQVNLMPRNGKESDLIFSESCYVKLHAVLHTWSLGVLKLTFLFTLLFIISLISGIYIHKFLKDKLCDNKHKGFGSLPSRPVPEFHEYEDDQMPIVPVRKVTKSQKKVSMANLPGSKSTGNLDD